MASAPSYSKSGVKSATPVKLDKAVFAVELSSHELIKSAYDSYLANGRGNSAVAKTRAAVSGGGKKPWRQKGTGRARAGSIRSPIWRSGGVVFGPTGKENYARKMHSATKRQALRQALSLSASEGRIQVLEAFDFKEGKTGDATKLLGKLEATGRALLVVSSKDDLALRATRNLANVKLVQANYLNVYDVVNAEHLVIDKKSLEIIAEQLGQTKAKTETAKAGDKK